ncbi:MAG: histidine--tRNA ligase [Bacteroidales bacterium]|jgi:histidyl-tRNA synthetase|nr:histidine--tRNA ligase [Bacteroidales bacterium]
MTQKPSIPKGTRDFPPDEMIRRDFIFNTIRQVFRLYGYQPIETPAMENLSTLLGKYGEEGDRLLFRILNSGDFLSGLDEKDLEGQDPSRISSLICGKGLRYDLTVPFARYVVQHRDQIIFPFKRYQIQPVWRADRPQRGRYREFFQCDADVIGSDSLLNEYELIRIIDDISGRLGISVTVKVNNRKVLAGIAEFIGEAEKITDITTAIDKLEKIGIKAVNEELGARGVSLEAISKLQPLIELEGSVEEKLGKLDIILTGSVVGKRGLDELRTLFSYIKADTPGCDIEVDITLARGLNYYTGAIIEVRSKDVSIGSICGGGRYDNLTGVFGMEGISGVGISFGADRIYDVMSQLNLFEEQVHGSPQVLIVNFGEKEAKHAIRLRNRLNKISISSELYPDGVRLKKQIAYADARNIPFVVMAGDEEIQNKVVTLKVMATSEQMKISETELIEYLKSRTLSTD